MGKIPAVFPICNGTDSVPLSPGLAQLTPINNNNNNKNNNNNNNTGHRTRITLIFSTKMSPITNYWNKLENLELQLLI